MSINNYMEEEKGYRLWWEYLRRSDDYKKLCEIIKKNKKHKVVKRISSPAGALNFTAKDGINVLTEFKKAKRKSKEFISLLVTYGFFGNVHTVSFKKWWSSAKKQIENRNKLPGLIEYIDFVQIDLLECVNDLKSIKVGKLIRDLNTDNHKEIIKYLKTVTGNDKEPTLKELIDYFPKYLKRKYTGGACLMVDVARKSKGELSKQFNEFIKERKQGHTMRMLERNSKRNYKISSNTMIRKSSLRSEELKRYLEIFDLEKKFNMKQIIKMKGKNSKDPNIVSIFHQDLNKARRIIKNVGSGSFPGDYQPKS